MSYSPATWPPPPTRVAAPSPAAGVEWAVAQALRPEQERETAERQLQYLRSLTDNLLHGRVSHHDVAQISTAMRTLIQAFHDSPIAHIDRWARED